MSKPSEDFKKYTVPQLKSLCKEKKITGYSKLGKNAIIQKLVEHEGSPTVFAQVSLVGSRESTGVHVSTEGIPCEPFSGPRLPPSAIQCPQRSPLPIRKSPSIDPHCNPNAGSHTSNAVPSDTRSVNKRPMEMLEADITTKKRKHLSSPVSTPASLHQNMGGRAPAPLVSTTISYHSSSRPKLNNHDISKPHEIVHTEKKIPSRLLQTLGPVITSPLAKRFVPLVITNHSKHLLTTPLHDISGKKQVLAAVPLRDLSNMLAGLDFSCGLPVPLRNVSLPPSLSRRKRVPLLAMALSAVPYEDLYACTQVSRLFRYSVYISAVYRLSAKFPGRRIELLMERYHSNMTDMWPYLRQREQELFFRRTTYQNSFLEKACKGKYGISGRMWSSPDNAKQVTIAVRFLLTCLFFRVSTGGGPLEQWLVTDVQELIQGEIWSITIRSSSLTEVLYVLEPTCEVVGNPPQTGRGKELVPASLRADWTAYIEQRLPSSSNTQANPSSLMSLLNWTNHEEYERGISRLWLKRIHGEGDLGIAKLIVAERYILACVVGNSVSGRWMSSTEMAQEFTGSSTFLTCPRQGVRVNLFLPAHHHIESLHFTSSSRNPLHPALAAVQTPAREYYILRDNGMQVGCEEDGVAPVWMELLGCDPCGIVHHSSDVYCDIPD